MVNLSFCIMDLHFCVLIKLGQLALLLKVKVPFCQNRRKVKNNPISES